MKRKAIIIILATIVVAMTALLLTGCWGKNREHSTQKEPGFHIPAPIDTAAMDEEFYRRMWEFEALHPSSPSDK